MIIIVVICKIANLAEYYEDAAIMFTDCQKNLTAAVLAGIGIALLNLKCIGFCFDMAICCLMFDKCYRDFSGFRICRSFVWFISNRINYYCWLMQQLDGWYRKCSCLYLQLIGWNLLLFAQMGNRLGGAIVFTIISGFLMQLLS